MPANKEVEIVGKIVDMLKPLPSEDRHRLMAASFTMLGENAADVKNAVHAPSMQNGSSGSEYPVKAQLWIRQNGITSDQLEQVFHSTGSAVDVIASDMTGKNKKEKTFNAYVLEGIAQLLLTGAPDFSDKAARALSERAGCYDSANHAVHISNRPNWFSGSKDKGWSLTGPGHKQGAALVKELSQGNG